MLRRPRLRQIHEIAVPAGPDGRPGERLLAHSRSMYRPRRLGPDGSREDFRVWVGRDSTLAAVCLGPVAERGHPRDRAEQATEHMAALGWARPYALVADEEVGGEPACRYRVDKLHQALIEWQVSRGDWAFVVGVLWRQRDDEDEVLTRTRAVLDTWRWVD